MNPLFATLLVILTALVGARMSFSTENIPQGPRLLFRTGTHFIFLGFLLGPSALGVLTSDALEPLFPFIALGLGWVGFLFGLQLDRQALAQFDRRLHAIAYGQAVLAFGIFAAIALGVLWWIGLGEQPWTIMAWSMAATACVTAPAGIAMVSSNFLVRGPVRQQLFFVSAVDAVVGIVALQFIYAAYHATRSFPQLGAMPGPFWVFSALALGVTIGIIFLWLTRSRPKGEELILYLIGTCAFASAAALRLHISPLFVCLVAGFVVANVSRDHRRIFTAVQRWEKPIYVIFLLLAGALLDVTSLLILPLAIGYVLVRGIAKVGGAWAITKALPPDHPTPPSWGSGLVAQGGISIAMALSVFLTFYQATSQDGAFGQLLFAVVVVGVVLNELAGPFFTVRLLRAANEISPAVEAALAEGRGADARAAALRHTPETGGPETGGPAPPPGSGGSKT